MFQDTLKRISMLRRIDPADTQSPRLRDLFSRLRLAQGTAEASQTEDEIWAAWMEHVDPAAEAALDEATRALASREYASAERLLDTLVEAHPEYAEAWNKRATLRFLQKRDEQSVADIERTLSLEPRHFGAICGFAQICLRRGEKDAALFALAEALHINPHLNSVKQAYEALLAESSTTRH
jgi:tetratricopeptide (TPR) repeat protein